MKIFLLLLIIILTSCIAPKKANNKNRNFNFNFRNPFFHDHQSIRDSFQRKIERKNIRLAINKSRKNEKLSYNLNFIWPLKNLHITSKYGKRVDPINKHKRFHHGIDLSAPKGENIFATDKGKVIWAKRNGGYGLTVMILHKNNMISLYAHLSKIEVKKGEFIKQGKIIGKVGSTGRSTGAHLHFEIRKNKHSVNPMDYLDKKSYKYSKI